MVDQQGYILGMVAKRRYGNGQNIYSIEKVLSKSSLFHCLFKVSVGCSNKPEICTYQFVSTQTLEFTFLQYP